MIYWLSVPAGLAAAALSYAINRFALSRLGGRAVWLAVPALEEAAKTGLALFAGASLTLTHVLFGAVEAVYEVSGRHPSLAAAGLALLTHGLLGLLTSALFSRSGSPAVAVASAAVVHTAYNLAVAGPGRGRGRGGGSRGGPGRGPGPEALTAEDGGRQ